MSTRSRSAKSLDGLALDEHLSSVEWKSSTGVPSIDISLAQVRGVILALKHVAALA